MGFLEDVKQLRRQVDALSRAVADQDDVLQTHEATLKDHEQRIGLLESVLEEVTTKLDVLGRYKERSTDELTVIRGELDKLLNVVETMVNHAVNTAGLQEAKALRTRLLKNRTLVGNILESRASA